MRTQLQRSSPKLEADVVVVDWLLRSLNSSCPALFVVVAASVVVAPASCVVVFVVVAAKRRRSSSLVLSAM